MDRKTRAPTATTLYPDMALYELERSMEEMELLLPSAKKAVWLRSSVVSVVAVGESSMRAVV